MPVVNLIPECYQELELMKEQIKNQKQKEGKKIKTTFSELICLLIRNYKKQDVMK